MSFRKVLLTVIWGILYIALSCYRMVLSDFHGNYLWYAIFAMIFHLCCRVLFQCPDGVILKTQFLKGLLEHFPCKCFLRYLSVRWLPPIVSVNTLFSNVNENIRWFAKGVDAFSLFEEAGLFGVFTTANHLFIFPFAWCLFHFYNKKVCSYMFLWQGKANTAIQLLKSVLDVNFLWISHCMAGKQLSLLLPPPPHLAFY